MALLIAARLAFTIRGIWRLLSYVPMLLGDWLMSIWIRQVKLRVRPSRQRYGSVRRRTVVCGRTIPPAVGSILLLAGVWKQYLGTAALGQNCRSNSDASVACRKTLFSVL